MEYAIEVQNITKSFKIYLDKGSQLKERVLFRGRNRYEERKVLKGISFQIPRGQAVGLIGVNGCGKSTTLKMLTKILYPDSGTITIDGQSVGKMNEKQLTSYRRRNLGYIFQSYNLIPNLTVRENIEVGAYLGDSPLDLDELISVLGLENHQDKLPSQLSGGQQQRTAIGRAIIKNPGILLCDEPTGALDSATSMEILKLIEKVNRTYGSCVLMVTHNEEIAAMADRIIRLRDGSIRSDTINRNRIAASDLQL